MQELDNNSNVKLTTVVDSEITNWTPDNITSVLSTSYNHLQTALNAIGSIPISVDISRHETELTLVKELLTQYIFQFEIREAGYYTYTVVPALVMYTTGKEVHTSVYNVTTDSKGIQHALCKIGRGVKEVYFSKLMNKWIVTD